MTNKEAEPTSLQQPKIKSKPCTKMCVILLVIASLLMGGIGGYLIGYNQSLSSPLSSPSTDNLSPTTNVSSPTPDQTADWETYINQQCSCSIKYPSDTKIFPEIFVDSNITRFEKFYQTPNNANVEEFIKTKNLLVDNYDAVMYRYEWSGHEQATPYYQLGTLINNNGTIIEIVAKTENEKEYELFKSVYNQILSTFKFLDDTETSGFECPTQTVLDCSIFTKCSGGKCPLGLPAYCSKGSAYYNFIVDNCPSVKIEGLD